MQVGNTFDELQGRTVVDLGCGTVRAARQHAHLVPGIPQDCAVQCFCKCNCKYSRCTRQGMLAIGAAVLGCPHVLGIDIDLDALAVAARNLEDVGGGELPVRCCIPGLCPSSRACAGFPWYFGDSVPGAAGVCTQHV